MPLTRPDRISDKVSLSDKVRRASCAFVAENSAVNSCLSRSVNELSPYENSVGGSGSEYNLGTWTGEQGSDSTILVGPG